MEPKPYDINSKGDIILVNNDENFSAKVVLQSLASSTSDDGILSKQSSSASTGPVHSMKHDIDINANSLKSESQSQSLRQSHAFNHNPAFSSSPLAVAENIKVVVRIRPPVSNEEDEPQAINIYGAQSLAVTNNDQSKTFNCSYDVVLGEAASQAELYGHVRECTLSVVEGVNATVFAYGMMLLLLRLICVTVCLDRSDWKREDLFHVRTFEQ